MILKVGSVVNLRSGGPRMTVNVIKESNLDGPYLIQCIWFDLTQHLDSGTFKVQQLRDVNGDDVAVAE